MNQNLIHNANYDGVDFRQQLSTGMAYFIPLVAGVCLGWTVCCVRPQGRRRQKAQTPWQHTIDSEDDAVRLEEGTRGHSTNRNRTATNTRSKTIWKDALGSVLAIKNMLQRRRNVGISPPRLTPSSRQITKPFLSREPNIACHLVRLITFLSPGQ